MDLTANHDPSEVKQIIILPLIAVLINVHLKHEPYFSMGKLMNNH